MKPSTLATIVAAITDVGRAMAYDDDADVARRAAMMLMGASLDIWICGRIDQPWDEAVAEVVAKVAGLPVEGTLQ